MNSAPPVKTKECPHCAEEIEVDAIKCRHCGEMLLAGEPEVLIHNEETKRCPHCAKEIKAESNYCQYCGGLMAGIKDRTTNGERKIRRLAFTRALVEIVFGSLAFFPQCYVFFRRLQYGYYRLTNLLVVIMHFSILAALFALMVYSSIKYFIDNKATYTGLNIWTGIASLYLGVWYTLYIVDLARHWTYFVSAFFYSVTGIIVIVLTSIIWSKQKGLEIT